MSIEPTCSMSAATTCPTCGQEIPGNLTTVDLSANAILAGGCTVKLTPREAEIAHLLWQSRPRALTVEYISDRIFKNDAEGSGYVPSLVLRLRRKIERGGLPIWIKAEQLRGYRWQDVIEHGAGHTAADHNKGTN